jgi:hypothetical protein
MVPGRLRRHRSGDRTERQLALGALALVLSHLHAPELGRGAAQTIPLSYWAEAFYAQQRARGASHQSALRALAFKWARILFRCWQDRAPYDEAKYQPFGVRV